MVGEGYRVRRMNYRVSWVPRSRVVIFGVNPESYRARQVSLYSSSKLQAGRYRNVVRLSARSSLVDRQAPTTIQALSRAGQNVNSKDNQRGDKMRCGVVTGAGSLVGA